MKSTASFQNMIKEVEAFFQACDEMNLSDEQINLLIDARERRNDFDGVETIIIAMMKHEQINREMD